MAKRVYDDMIRYSEVLRHTLSSRHVERDEVGAEKVGREEQSDRIRNRVIQIAIASHEYFNQRPLSLTPKPPSPHSYPQRCLIQLQTKVSSETMNYRLLSQIRPFVRASHTASALFVQL